MDPETIREHPLEFVVLGAVVVALITSATSPEGIITTLQKPSGPAATPAAGPAAAPQVYDAPAGGLGVDESRKCPGNWAYGTVPPGGRAIRTAMKAYGSPDVLENPNGPFCVNGVVLSFLPDLVQPGDVIGVQDP